MKNFWKYVSSCVTVIVIGLALFFFAIWLAAKAFIPSYDEPNQPKIEIIFKETPVTEFELQLLEEQETQEFLKLIDRFWNEHKNCEYWKENFK